MLTQLTDSVPEFSVSLFEESQARGMGVCGWEQRLSLELIAQSCPSPA